MDIERPLDYSKSHDRGQIDHAEFFKSLQSKAISGIFSTPDYNNKRVIKLQNDARDAFLRQLRLLIAFNRLVAIDYERAKYFALSKKHFHIPSHELVYSPTGISIVEKDRKSTRLNSSHRNTSRMPSSA